MAALCIDLGGTRLRGALAASDGTLTARAAEPTRAVDGADAVTAQIAAMAHRIAGGRDVTGLALCAPGPLDAIAGRALATPTIPGFVDYPLRDRLSALVPWPVRLENDALAATMGEWRHGAGQGTRDMVYLTVSTGIGGGAVAGGELVRGRRGMAGHFGHMVVQADGPACPCGNRGCWEALASGTAFAARARAAGFADGAAVFAAASDPAADALIADQARWLAIGIVNVAHVHSPETIVIGGGMAAAFDRLAPPIRAHVDRMAMAPFRDVTIRRAALGDDSGLIGLAALVAG